MQNHPNLAPSTPKCSTQNTPLTPKKHTPIFDTSDYRYYEINDPDEDFVHQDED